jgi:hypothetical protein
MPEEKKCKHGIMQQCCSLCLGYQQEVEGKSGPPAWLTDDLSSPELLDIEGTDEN